MKNREGESREKSASIRGFTILGVLPIPAKSVREDYLLVRLRYFLLKIKKVTIHPINQTAFDNRREVEKVVE
ncbi:hypothetical protein PanWU01x14_346000 [Parasponia andersonii]|uniref:Uncharacterized protein n=1 Tax=Parasponia andersonii TaxID=3476 RepID=A0A2P5ACI8_PARAD|nr:hypothetical protein PanWU01x14_346000 [Parasponia andersonii]